MSLPITLTRRSLLAAAALIATAAAAKAQSRSQPGTKPNDAQIAHIVYTADTIDIKMGQLALQKSKNPKVTAFAEDMVRDHAAVNEKALALAKKLDVTPQGNDTGRALTQQADAEYQRLSALSEAGFDVRVTSGSKGGAVATRPGPFTYTCRYHPTMTGQIVVQP